MRKLFFALSLILISSFAFAADPNIRLEVEPRTIGLDETSIIKIVSDVKADSIDMPEVQDSCHLTYQGVSSSQSFTIVNGVSSHTFDYIYTFVFVSDKIGTYRLDPFTVNVGGKKYFSDGVTIKVVKEPQNVNQNLQDDIFSIFGNRRQNAFQPKAFMKMFYKPLEVYQNQQTMVEIYAYANDKSILSAQMVEASPLMTDKFIFYDVTQSVSNLDDIVEDPSAGEGFRRMLKRYVCFPIEAGKLTLRSPVLVAVSQYGQIRLDANIEEIQALPVGRQGGLNYIGDLRAESKLSTNVRNWAKLSN
jgi:hypothetical protein